MKKKCPICYNEMHSNVEQIKGKTCIVHICSCGYNDKNSNNYHIVLQALVR